MPDAARPSLLNSGDNPVEFRCLRLFSHRRRWGLTWRGWLLAFLIAAGAGVTGFLRVHPFLAVTDRVDATVLVVEGWVPSSALKLAAEEFHRGGYQVLCVTGGVQSAVIDGNKAPSNAVRKLEDFGVPRSALHSVPGGSMRNDRTYSNAAALRKWLESHQGFSGGINVMTLSVHGRRSRLMHQKAFDGKAPIGIISAVDPEYDPDRWWHYSRGVKEVISEAAAWVYARMIFRADDGQGGK